MGYQPKPKWADVADDAFCHRLASIYVDTLGTFRFRIQVKTGLNAKLP